MHANNAASDHPIELVMFDMDGTLLDLTFDYVFWSLTAISKWAELNHTTIAEAKAKFYPLIERTRGTLDFYSLPFWSKAFGLDLAQLTADHAHLIEPRPFALELLAALHQQGVRCWLTTNAHSQVLDIKLNSVPMRHYFERIVTSDQLNAPKEEQAYWDNLQQLHAFTPERTLFIDDNIDVLLAAKQYGIGHLLCISQPMMNAPPITSAPLPLLGHLSEVLHFIKHLKPTISI